MYVRLIFPSAIKPVCLSFALITMWLLSSFVAQPQTVSADFGNRSGTTPVVPSGMFAVGGIGSTLSDRGAINTLAAAGINETRFWIDLSQIYSKNNPTFKALDRTLEELKSAGVHPIAVIQGDPANLGETSCAPPSDIWQWGQLAAGVVAHIDQKFPGLLQEYEIWNEPELPTSLCVADDTARLNTYVSMFAAAASAMHAQAEADGESIRTGGPVISRIALAPVWIPALVNNESTAPYVDFISFHVYVTGQINIDLGMTWWDLYSITQSSAHGLIHDYNLIEPLVRAGQQPNAASTPIYITEFNDNWAGSPDCCRNDPTYGSLWNTLAIADFLNVVYTGATAVPSRLVYFNVSSYRYFCILGEWNAKMDCNPSVMEPYPQFYAYQLFASPDYLDLQAGGNMAVSVSSANTSELQTTAFYTSSADSVVVVNPTSTTYSRLNIMLANPGLTSPTGTVFLLDNLHGKIASEPVALRSISGGYAATVEVPPHSTVALSVKGSQAGNPPTPVLTVTPLSGTHPLTVEIDSSQSNRGGSYIIGRTIDFGDGTWLNWAPTPSYTYNKAGNYTIRLLLKDQFGQLVSTSTVLTVY